MKICCQTITFGNERHRKDLGDIVKAVAEAGYQGIETGFFRLEAAETEKIRNLMAHHSLSLTAIHIGGNFYDTEFVKKMIESIGDVINFAHFFSCDNIFVSGGAPKENEDYLTAAQNLEKLGAKIKSEGVTLSYHNHDWEIKDNLHGLYTIYDNTSPESLSFVPDIGWVTHGGADPVEVVKKLGTRVSEVHFKEFTSDGSFTELGKGIVNFRGVYEILKDRDIWFIAEQDVSTIGAETSIAENYRFIKNLERY